MKPDEIDRLCSLSDGPALDTEMAARVMGWTEDGYGWRLPSGEWAIYSSWHPTRYHGQAAEVLERITELGLLDAWLAAVLQDPSFDDAMFSTECLRIIATASPGDRCRAALRAVLEAAE